MIYRVSAEVGESKVTSFRTALKRPHDPMAPDTQLEDIEVIQY